MLGSPTMATAAGAGAGEYAGVGDDAILALNREALAHQLDLYDPGTDCPALGATSRLDQLKK